MSVRFAGIVTLTCRMLLVLRSGDAPDCRWSCSNKSGPAMSTARMAGIQMGNPGLENSNESRKRPENCLQTSNSIQMTKGCVGPISL